jgi:FkbM family methyltransferase
MLPERALRLFWRLILANPEFVARHGWQYFGYLADRVKIDGVSATGRYGTFVGSPKDAYILREYANTGSWAAKTIDLISNFFGNDQGTYIDIGANIGLTSVPIASQCPGVTCFAFEPEPRNFSYLQSNIIAHDLHGRIVAQRVALFDKEGTLDFELSHANLGDHRVRVTTAARELLDESSRQITKVPCKRLDDISITIEGKLFAKIDTQGAEPYIIAGGSRTLAQAEMILLEWSPYLMRRMASNPKIAIDFLGANFCSGAFCESGDFHPVDAFCNLLEHSLSEFDGMDYTDIIVRK